MAACTARNTSTPCAKNIKRFVPPSVGGRSSDWPALRPAPMVTTATTNTASARRAMRTPASCSAWKRKPEVGDHKPEVGDHKPEVGDQRSEVAIKRRLES